MTNYDFSTLNDKEFEQIARDLLNAQFDLKLQSFKAGRDKGIDLRYSTPENNNAIVVQVKHYISSGFAQLKHTLKHSEFPKVDLLRPERYIIVTSLSLKADKKDELKAELAPYVINSNDIIGQEDLNAYLASHKEIEKRYFKLWFSSIEVFNSVLNNAVEGRTGYMLEAIRKKIPYYVITKKLDDANKKLLKEKLLLITGQPGIGKTTLAEIILFERAKVGFKIYKVESILEAEDMISVDEEEQQLFYFDDFLGANYYEIVNAHKTETQITSFVERIRNTPNKYLILTTRTVILNHAVEKYEKISHSKLGNRKFEIKLDDYSKFEKALILYNHLYFKELDSKFLEAIREDKFYFKIIAHKNYTPRIIEFITDETKIERFGKPQYLQFVMNNLENPKEIWRYSYNNQIDYMERCLLLTLFTFENGMSENVLLNAFEERLRYEKSEHNQIIGSNQFTDSVKILLNGFIASTIYDMGTAVRGYNFINPSLADFFIGYVGESFSERKSIISSIIYVEQLKRFNPKSATIPLEPDLQRIIRDKISRSELKVLSSGDPNKKTAILLESIINYCPDVNIDSLLLANLKKISLDPNWANIDSIMMYVLEKIGDAPETIAYVSDNFYPIIEKLMFCIDSEDLAKKIPFIFEQYCFDFEAYTNSEEGFQNTIDLIKLVLIRTEESLKNEREDGITDFEDVEEIYTELDSIEGSLMRALFPDVSIDYDFGVKADEEYWFNKIDQNTEKEEPDVEVDDYYHDDPRFDDDHLIEDLFEIGEY